MSVNIFWLFHFWKKTSQQVRAFYDAVTAVETYLQAEEFETALLAAAEVMLKIKIQINYYINAEKKHILILKLFLNRQKRKLHWLIKT
jgi:hypothetical protein